MSEFKGKRLVGLREHYQKEGSGWLPGKKGISLAIEQFEELAKVAPVRNCSRCLELCCRTLYFELI